MLPPLTTATTCSSGATLILPASNAATAAAAHLGRELGALIDEPEAAAQFVLGQIDRVVDMLRQTSRHRVPITGAASASAAVGSADFGIGRPASSDRRSDPTASGCTPTIRTPGRADFTATAIPEINPPPYHLAPPRHRHRADPGRSPDPPSPDRPSPANRQGCNTIRPVSAAIARIRSNASAASADSKSTSAP